MEIVKVVLNTNDMDNETFALHMTMRHRDSLGGLPALHLNNGHGAAPAWRSFHKRLHEVRHDLEHSHEQRWEMK